MGHIILSADEAGINQTFIAVYNAIEFPGVSRSFAVPAAGGQFGIKATAQFLPIDYPSTAMPVDLRGSALTPQIRIGPMALRVVTDVEVKFQQGGWSRTATAQCQAEVMAEAHAQVSSSLVGNNWRTRLSVMAADVAVSLEPNRQPLIDAVKSALAHIDISPLPGPQNVPPAVISQVVGHVFDKLTAPIETALTDALRGRLGLLRADIVASLPRQWTVAVPGGANTVTLTVGTLDTQVLANQVRVTAGFSVS